MISLRSTRGGGGGCGAGDEEIDVCGLRNESKTLRQQATVLHISCSTFGSSFSSIIHIDLRLKSIALWQTRGRWEMSTEPRLVILSCGRPEGLARLDERARSLKPAIDLVGFCSDFPALQCRAEQNKVPLGLRRRSDMSGIFPTELSPGRASSVLARGFNPGNWPRDDAFQPALAFGICSRELLIRKRVGRFPPASVVSACRWWGSGRPHSVSRTLRWLARGGVLLRSRRI